MKKYPIEFVDDYIRYEEWKNDTTKDEFTRNFYREELLGNEDKLKQCKKWLGKELTLSEVEENIEEFKEVLFNGKTIMIVNGILA